MRADVALLRAMPVRGPGRFVVANLRRRARRGVVTASGPHGVRLLIDPHNPPELSVYLWGTYEPEVVSALERVVVPGRTAVDVGANCGVLSVLMRRLAGSDGRLLAVDPSPAACRRVSDQARVNNMRDLRVVEAGLGAAPRRAAFRAGTVGIGMLPDADAQFTSGEARDVRVTTLDDLLSEAPDLPPVGVVKIDTDGSEIDVLEGARNLLRRDRPVLVFEVFGDGMRRRGREPGVLADLLDEHRYDLFVAETKPAGRWRVAPPVVLGFTPASLRAVADGTVDDQNVVAIDRLDDGQRARSALLATS